MTNFEIPIKIYFGEFEEIIKELGQLQTYKLFEGAEEVLVDINDVARVLAKHVKATTAEPEIIHCAECKWFQCNTSMEGHLPKGVDEFECRHSRQAAIDTLCDNCDHVEAVCPHYPCKQYMAIENLPSAQPEIIRCKECKHYVDGYIHCNRVTWWNGEDDFCSRAERRDGCDDGGGA